MVSKGHNTNAGGRAEPNPVAELLSALDIRVVCVIDDAFEERTHDESLSEKARLLRAAAAKSDAFANRFPSDAAIRVGGGEAQTRDWIGQQADVESLLAEAADLAGDVDDLGEETSWKRLLGSGVELKCMTPNVWKRDGAALLAEAKPDNRLLCLFDFNLVSAGQGAEGGLRLLTGAEEGQPKDDSTYFSIVSETFDVGGERKFWREHTKDRPELRSAFLPISKQRRSEPAQFALGIKVSILNRHQDDIKASVQAILANAHEEAANRLEQLDPWDFDQIVFRSSEAEGVWEGETLFRVHSLFERKYARAGVLAERSVFDRAAAKVRAMRNLPDLGEKQTAEVEALVRFENYDEDVSKFQLPLHIGDVFEAAGGRRWMLTSQPCDIALRSDGQRNSKIGVLVPIVAGKANRAPRFLSCEGWLCSGPPQSAHFDFQEAVEVPLKVLDLCVFNAIGVCRSGRDEPAPAPLTPGWAVRLTELHRDGVEIIDAYQAAAKALERAQSDDGPRAEVLKPLLLGLTGASADPPLNPTCNDDGLDFGLTRVGRYEERKAAEVLDSMAAYRARNWGPHELTRRQ